MKKLKNSPVERGVWLGFRSAMEITKPVLYILKINIFLNTRICIQA